MTTKAQSAINELLDCKINIGRVRLELKKGRPYFALLRKDRLSQNLAERCGLAVTSHEFPLDQFIEVLATNKTRILHLEVQSGRDGFNGDDIGSVLLDVANSKGRIPSHGFRRLTARLHVEGEIGDTFDMAARDSRLVSRLPSESLPLKSSDGRSSKVVRNIDFEGLSMNLYKQLAPELIKLHDPIIRKIQELLDELEGSACPSFSQNVELTTTITQIATRFGIALQYPDEAGQFWPVRMRCILPRGSKAGIFQARNSSNYPLCSSVVWPRLLAARAV